MRFADDLSSLSGTADVNSFSVTAVLRVASSPYGASLTRSFSAASNGRFPLTLTITPTNGHPAPEFTTLNLTRHIVDATQLILDPDATKPGRGVMQLQKTGL